MFLKTFESLAEVAETFIGWISIFAWVPACFVLHELFLRIAISHKMHRFFAGKQPEATTKTTWVAFPIPHKWICIFADLKMVALPENRFPIMSNTLKTNGVIEDQVLGRMLIMPNINKKASLEPYEIRIFVARVRNVN